MGWEGGREGRGEEEREGGREGGREGRGEEEREGRERREGRGREREGGKGGREGGRENRRKKIEEGRRKEERGKVNDSLNHYNTTTLTTKPSTCANAEKRNE